ncbi:unnamed protein product [Litomosoides sigmodontis]|uniref:Uncharacterized protein n=1 Tax=Litomosoides sigmodontis TaxID=42156 RepID=A0A3P6U143_LITSI|nr:unnamed protein product [Litomosoides sigmodontis]
MARIATLKYFCLLRSIDPSTKLIASLLCSVPFWTMGLTTQLFTRQGIDRSSAFFFTSASSSSIVTFTDNLTFQDEK